MDQVSGDPAAMTIQCTPQNETLCQMFEWHTPSDPPPPTESHAVGSHYALLKSIVPPLSEIGVTKIWLPPGCKANNSKGNGYDVYDLWDLGEFVQKRARSTKWGSREELGDLMAVARQCKVECIWDAVLNHKTAGDSTDKAWAVEVDPEGARFVQDRRFEICPPKMIEAWLRFDFPGRDKDGMRYSRMKWRAEHFNGTDWDQRGERHAIFKLIDDPAMSPKPFQQPQRNAQERDVNGTNHVVRLLKKLVALVATAKAQQRPPKQRPGKGWAEDVSDQHGNFDYLMFSNINYQHPEVRRDVLNWGRWMVQEVGVGGFRLDAAQHFSSDFAREWIRTVQEARRVKGDEPAFIVGEVWSGEVSRILNWLAAVRQPIGPQPYAYDSPLLYNFSRISSDVYHGSPNADLRTAMRNSLVSRLPERAVTFVTNHDTQLGQTMYTPMHTSLKSLWYALILLRQEGLPCVFWGDLYGTRGPFAEAAACLSLDEKKSSEKRSLLPDLMMCRKLFAYGSQKDYWDAADCVGWTRSGTTDRPGCAVIASICPRSEQSTKKMVIGQPGEKYFNILGNLGDEVTIDAKGTGVFACPGTSVGVYVRRLESEANAFPVAFNTGLYENLRTV